MRLELAVPGVLAILALGLLDGCATARPACELAMTVTASPTRREVPTIPAPFTRPRTRRALEVEPAATLTCTIRTEER